MSLAAAGSGVGAANHHASIVHISTALPQTCLTNDDLARIFPRWTPERIYEKTGIRTRRLSGAQGVADLACAACESLFAETDMDREAIDALLICTECPDAPLPPVACVVQHRLGLSTRCAALDYNLGCSGYVYGLALARAMVESGLSRNLLLVTSETYSKYIAPDDASVSTLFGDGASATLVSLQDGSEQTIGPFVFGSDGSGAANLTVVPDADPRLPRGRLVMKGPEIFNFTLDAVPRCVDNLLQEAGLALEQVDYFVFHQANLYMIEHLRKKIGIPREKFAYCLEDCGNTVSTSIPLALRRAADSGAIAQGMRVALVGFGVGYSWAACMVRWGAHRRASRALGQPGCPGRCEKGR